MDKINNQCDDDDQRNLSTPAQSQLRLEQNRGSRSRSRSLLLRRREAELDLERRRLRRLERQLEEDREESRSRRSERRGRSSRHRSGSRCRSGSRRRSGGRRRSGSRRRSGGSRRSVSRQRSEANGVAPGAETNRRRTGAGSNHSPRRSRSPIFTSKDISNIIQQVKTGLSFPPVVQATQPNIRSIDHQNILPNFNPSAKNQRVDVWLKKVNECACVYGWDDKTTIHFAMQKLQGLAKTWFESLNSILYSWPQWQEKLISAFPCEQNYGQALEEMLKRRSRFGEPIEVYFYEKLALLNQCEIQGKRAVDCIIHGISDKTIKSSALALRCSEPDVLLQFLLSNKETMNSQFPPRFRNSATNNTDNSQSQNKSFPKQAFSSVFCFNCKDKGHFYPQCPKPLLKCKRCHKIGHVLETCVSKDKPQNPPDTVQKTMCIFTSDQSTKAKFIKQILVNGRQLEAFVDLGSDVTLIKESVLVDLGISHNQQPSGMVGFGNGLVYSLGSALLDLTIDGVKAIVSCKVVRDNLLEKSLLVGQSFSEQPHVVIFKDSKVLQFMTLDSILPKQDLLENEDDLVRVRVSKHCKLYGAASIRAATLPVFSGNLMISTKVVGKPHEQFVVSGGIYLVNNGEMYVNVTPCSIPCFLQQNSVFSRAERIEVVNRIAAPVPATDSSVPAHLDTDKVQIGDSVTEGEKNRLFALLHDYKHCFAQDLAGLGCTNSTEMNIELNSQRPVVYRPYRLSQHERDKVRQMVGDMMDAGIIRESVSSYASPIILVKKKDGSSRLCVDYRMLNSITVKERYPMPIIDDEIARLSGQACFITLDLMSGYYQVPIAEQSRPLTAFVTPDGQYEFNRMPFGLANAPAVFQRMMNHVLGPARFNKATVYIDDLLIFGKDSNECLDRLEEILKLLEHANLKLNLSKCTFLRKEIDYLGYEISSEGIRPGKTKIQSVINFPRPVNVHGVRQFLGLVSYFRKFIYGFAEKASPLTSLLKKDASWLWAEDQEAAFSVLKEHLADRPVLAIFDPLAETELHTDASRIGVGGMLLQRLSDKDSFRPVAYYSRKTTPEEKNFHAYELETLAVVCALKKFRVYLLGKKFKIITDCSALRSTFVKRDLVPRIARWWLALQEFDCSIEYRAGGKMSHVDALSRNPVSVLENQDFEILPAVMSISDQDWLLTLQLGDSELRRIRDILNSRLDESGLDYIKKNYLIQNNRLFRRVGDNDNDIRWVVPKGARWQLCKLNHDDIGHVGFEKTLDRIKSKYWFSKMARFVKKYVGACIECAYAKKSVSKREGFLHPIEKVEKPFHTLHIDHLGPFVKSKQGYTHILVVVDAFTKFVFIRPVRNTKTQGVIKVLDDIFNTFRAPERLVSDRGSCFTAHAFRRFCLDRGVKHVLNAVASPRSNGQVERYNRTILDSLTAQNLKHDDRDWDNKLGRIQWGLNNTLQKTIGRAPAEVLFGTSMSGEVSPILNEIADGTRETVDLAVLRDSVKERIDKEQAYQKQVYDKGRRPARTYAHGDLVKITKTAFQNNGKSSKLLPVYEGPYRVIKVLGNDRYKLAPIPGFEGMKHKRKTTVAADRMLPWIHISALEVDGSSDEGDEGEHET